MVAEPMSREGAGNRTRLTGRLVIYFYIGPHAASSIRQPAERLYRARWKNWL
ncbi:MAG: hypothetical protein ACI93G_001456, partial [Hyphomonas sp.]